MDSLFHRGIKAIHEQRYADAVPLLRDAQAECHENPALFANLGHALQQLGQLEEALDSYGRAIAIKPDYAGVYYNRGIILNALGRLDDSIRQYDKAIELSPLLASAFFNRGNVFQDKGDLLGALGDYDRAIAIKSDYYQAYTNRGYVLQKLNRPAEAIKSLDHAIQYCPGFPAAHWNKASSLLMLGKLQEGWKYYEWRHVAASPRAKPRRFDVPLWLGNEALLGKTILLHSEQGRGDTIQFCRFIPEVVKLGAQVVVELENDLIPLVSSVHRDCLFIAKGCSLPAFDFHCPIMSLPLAFNTGVATIPSTVPYLSPDPDRQNKWQSRLGPRNKPRIGIAWSGSSANPTDKSRSIPVRLLEPLFRLPLEFHCLQKEIRADDAVALSELPPIQVHSDDLVDFADTAALIAEMDLVVSVCTSVAHVAGAVGKPVWILLAWSADWRWLLDRNDSPWYPAARLLRQPGAGDWSSVASLASGDLEMMFQGTRQGVAILA